MDTLWSSTRRQCIIKVLEFQFQEEIKVKSPGVEVQGDVTVTEIDRPGEAIRAEAIGIPTTTDMPMVTAIGDGKFA